MYKIGTSGFYGMIDRYRTGNYGEDGYGDPICECEGCGCDLDHKTIYDFNNELLCEDCYRDKLFEVYHKEHETTLEDYYG